MDIIQKILHNDMCLGCGLCSAVENRQIMDINERGFYIPDIFAISKHSIDVISHVCPGINIIASKESSNKIWGNVMAVSNAWASDPVLRFAAASGGVTSALAIFLLETRKVDAILHVGVAESGYLLNKLYVSKSKDDVLHNCSSRYAPADVFSDIFKILDANRDTYAFIGKPCDIAAIKNTLGIYSKYKERIKFFLAIFCAGMPSYNATIKAISSFDKNCEPITLKYRGDGWPGYFKVKYVDGTINRMTYKDSWGKILGRDLKFRCKICPDGIGMLADISSGDAWNTKDGYPDFNEEEGKNFCFIRTKQGQSIFDEAKKSGYIQTEKLTLSSIKEIQPHQYERRRVSVLRIVVVQLMTLGILNFKNTEYFKAFFELSVKTIIREILGTVKRFVNVRKQWGVHKK